LGYGTKDFGLIDYKMPGAGTYDIPSDINPEKRKYSAIAFGTGRDVS
jgi:hypothetical protein